MLSYKDFQRFAAHVVSHDALVQGIIRFRGTCRFRARISNENRHAFQRSLPRYLIITTFFEISDQNGSYWLSNFDRFLHRRRGEYTTWHHITSPHIT